MLIVYFFLVFLFAKYFLFIFASIKVIKSKFIIKYNSIYGKKCFICVGSCSFHLWL